MADMAAPDQLEMCWSDLAQMGLLKGGAAPGENDPGIVPVTYINSAASIKAFCGERGGVVCTSSNAAATLKWGWERGERILFLPDQHLGRNTAYKRGVPLDEMVVWDPNEIWGGLEPEAVKKARMILWKGHCSVHARFTVRQIEHLRARHPGLRVIVHPEVSWDVVQAADDSGSTEYIIKTVKESAVGSIWAVGTETPPRQSSRPAGCAGSHRPVARSVPAAYVRRCSACRPIICFGFWKDCWTARSTTASSCPTIRSTGQRSHWIACCRFTTSVPYQWFAT